MVLQVLRALAGVQLHLVWMKGDSSLGFVDLVKVGA